MNSIDEACKLLAIIAKSKARYDSVNATLRGIQGDFPTHIEAIDIEVEDAVIKMLDKMLGAELASYWLYECDGGKGRAGLIEDDGREWRIKSIGDVKRYARFRARKQRCLSKKK